MPRAARWLVLALLFGASVGLGLGSCAGNHSSLAKTPGGAGPGGSEGGGGHGADGATGGAPTTTGSGAAGAGGSVPEPVGPNMLTLANGIVDWDEIRLCVVPYPAGGDSLPWPTNDGLDFARARAVDPLSTVVPADSDVEIHVLAGDLAQSYGQSCSDLLTAPAPADDAAAPLLHASLGVVPSSVFSSNRSLLLVAYGCVGGPGHTDAVQDQICGATYAPGTPSVALAAGAMSRITEPSHVSLQFADASAAIMQAQLRMHAGEEAAPAFLVTQYWSLGAILPYPPWTQFSRQELGVVDQAGIQIFTSSPAMPAAEITLAQTFANSELGAGDIVDGAGYVLIAVGASPGLPDGPWWHAFTMTMVRADP